jgi:hypothetical protein
MNGSNLIKRTIEEAGESSPLMHLKTTLVVHKIAQMEDVVCDQLGIASAYA